MSEVLSGIVAKHFKVHLVEVVELQSDIPLQQ